MTQIIRTLSFSLLVVFWISCDSSNSSNQEIKDSGISESDIGNFDAVEKGVLKKCGHDFKQVRAVRKIFLNNFFRLYRTEKAVPAVSVFNNKPQVIVNGTEGTVPHAGVYNGRKAICKLFGSIFNEQKITALKVQYHLVSHEHVSSHIQLQALVLSTGKMIDLEYVFLWKYPDSKSLRPVSCRIYYDTDLIQQAYSVEGPVQLADISNKADDYKVVQTSYDTAGIIEVLYDYFYNGEVEAVLNMLHPTDTNIYFKGPLDGYPFAGHYIGHEGTLTFMYNLGSSTQPFHFEAFYVAEGDRADAFIYEEATVFATTKIFRMHAVHSWRINDEGIVLGFTAFPDSQVIAEAYLP